MSPSDAPIADGGDAASDLTTDLVAGMAAAVELVRCTRLFAPNVAQKPWSPSGPVETVPFIVVIASVNEAAKPAPSATRLLSSGGGAKSPP